ncbi:membrane transport protein-domain-containing protein [Phellopilus nigrolimitatus]|nr:membrane transport protein-domain-containing protein [Phellopilus nigrolimitatus]
MAPIVLLLRTVFEAILEVFLLCLAGYILARKAILDKRTQKQLNRLNISLFTPSLLFSKVAFSLSPAKLRELWIIPLFFVLVTAVSMCVSYFLGWVFRVKRSQRNFAIAASMFMNSNSLPIALMQSLVVTVPGLKWDDDDTKDAMLGRALSYLVLYSTLGMVLRWSYGVHLLSQADPEAQKGQAGEGEDGTEEGSQPDTYVDESHSLLIDPDENNSTPATVPQDDRRISVVLTGADSSGSQETLPRHDSGRLHAHTHSHRNTSSRVFLSFPNTPTRSAVTLPQSSSSLSPYDRERYDSDSDTDTEESLLLPSSSEPRRGTRRTTLPSSSLRHSLLHRFWHCTKKFLRTLNAFMTMPLWAATLSLIVVLVPPLQHTLDAHVQPFKGALTAAGNCSIPLTLVVLGAYFYTPPSEEKPAHAMPKDNLANRRERANENENGAVAPAESPRRRSFSSSFAGSVRSMLRLSRLDLVNNALTKERTENTTLPGETRTVFIAVLSRMLLTPLLLLPLMALSAKYDIPKVFDDPVFIVSNVLLISSPPALTLAQIAQAASSDAFERLISRTIFWAYCVVTPPATIAYVIVGLLLAKL